MKFKDWNIKGKQKNPTLKYSIDGYLFESDKHIMEYVPSLKDYEIRNRIQSNKPIYRHWFKLKTPIKNMSCEEVENSLIDCKIRMECPIIRCEGIEFHSTNEAGEYFNVSAERIRQKLLSIDWSDYVYLYDKDTSNLVSFKNLNNRTPKVPKVPKRRLTNIEKLEKQKLAYEGYKIKYKEKYYQNLEENRKIARERYYINLEENRERAKESTRRRRERIKLSK
jgi:hypothetical protein